MVSLKIFSLLYANTASKDNSTNINVLNGNYTAERAMEITMRQNGAAGEKYRYQVGQGQSQNGSGKAADAVPPEEAGIHYTNQVFRIM